MLSIVCGDCTRPTAPQLITHIGAHGVRSGRPSAQTWLCPRCYATWLAHEAQLAIVLEAQPERRVRPDRKVRFPGRRRCP